MPSSVLSVMIYDPAAQVLTYQYYGVPDDEWQRFRDAPSKGTYLNQQFKEKAFRFDRFPKGKAPRMPHGSLRWT